MTSEVKAAYENSEGALITNVEKGSSAELAGLKRGDLILKVNDKNIKGASDLKNYIGGLEPGKKVIIIYERDKVSKSTSLVLKGDTAAVSEAGLIEGLELKDLEKGRNSRIPSNINGVLVMSVKDGSKAQKAGFEQGDIIIGVEQEEIKNLQHLSQILKQNRSKSFTKIWVYRNGYAQLLVLK